MSSLYNHTSGLSPDFNTMTTASKTMRTDMGRYPGGVSFLTDKDIQDPTIEVTTGNNTNGRIQVSLQTRTIDQDYINKYQFVWLDNEKTYSPKFLNLQSLNYELLSFCNPVDREQKAKNKKSEKTMTMKQMIMERFQLFGVIANNDTDNNFDMPTVRSPRAISFTFWGSTHVLDYWSNREHGRVAPYSTCYFILKKVEVKPSDLYQRTLKSSVTTSGIHPHEGLVDWPKDPVDGKNMPIYTWQVVPYHNWKNEIDIDQVVYDYKENDIAKSCIGHYWKVGHVHEYPDLAKRAILDTRDARSVSRNMTYLHMTGSVRPMQFYMDISAGNTLI